LDQQARNKSTRVKSVVAVTTIALYSVAVSLLLLEGAVRIYLAAVSPKMMVLDEKLGWRHAANASKTFVNDDGEPVRVEQNANGHRGVFRGFQKTPSKFRILTLGDSQTEAVQVGETELFTARIEQADSHFEVLNAGVGGYNTVQEYLYLVSEGLKFRPDLVMLMFMGNDLTDNGIPYSAGFGPRPYSTYKHGSAQIVEQPESQPFERFILPFPFRMALNSYSYFYYFVNSRIYQGMFAQQMQQLQKNDVRQLDQTSQLAMADMVLDKLHRLLDEHDVPLLIVLVPERENVASGNFEGGGRISEYCIREKINCLSLMERFRAETASKTRLYFESDIHWTKEGHRIAADEISRYLSLNYQIELQAKQPAVARTSEY
jgi:hypothetical protein